MSLPKQRIQSANCVPQHQRSLKKRRYQKLVTQSSVQFYKQPTSKMRSYSRNQSKKGNLNQNNLTMSKEPEQMIEQNHNLKLFINQLQEQLSLQRGRLEMNKKKTQKFVKQLNRQFDKEMYYSGKNPHSYMFSGIKHQYENMKHLYQQKCNEIQRLAKIGQITRFQEISTYIEVLEDENKLLKEKLEEFYNMKRPTTNFKFKKGSRRQKYSEVDRLYTDLNDSENDVQNDGAPENFEQKINEKREEIVLQRYKQKCKQLETSNVQLKKTVQFLEQLIIQKDNNEHHAKRQSKKILKVKNQLQVEINRLQQNIKEIQIENQAKLNSIIEKESKKFEIQSSIFKKELLEKSSHIQKLQKQIRFLSTMLSYWKPLDQVGRNDLFNLKEPSEKDQLAQSVKIKPNQMRKSSAVASDHFMPSDFMRQNTVQNDPNMSVRSNFQDDINKRTSGVRSQSQQNMFNSLKQRVPQTCGKKFKGTAKKCRKVQLRDIKQIGQLIRYRLIGNNITTEHLKSLFDLNEECQEPEKEFRTQYISMREIKGILMQYPFSMNEEDSVLISRYIVENEASQFVYWDQDNETHRTIAKSIIKALIGEYKLPDPHDILAEWQKLKQQYLFNIQSALKIIAPKGLITQNKFIELLIGLGIELKDQLKDWIVAKMVIQSTSLKQLNYKTLIPQ